MAKKTDAKAAKGETVSPMEEWVSRARGIGLILGFVVSFYVCRGQGFPIADAVLRGLVGAAVLSVFGLWSALLVIQALMRAAAAQAQREAQVAAAEAAAARHEEDAAFARRAAPVPAPDEAG